MVQLHEGMQVMRHWAAALAGLVVAIPLVAADPLDGHDCFSSDNDRRIKGCTELIERPELTGQLLGSAYAMRALGYSLKGLYDEAIRDYDEAIRLVPDFAVALNNRAWAYFKSGRAEEGLPDVERSLQLQPTSPHAYDTRAHIRQVMGDPEGALRDYESAMRFGGERMVQLYQCGLAALGLYGGPVDGIYTPILRRAIEACVTSKTCDPLPPDEECRAVTS
jgi:tetratricopeptide (TPR) repeat protein